MLVQRQTPSVQVFNRVGFGMLSFHMDVIYSSIYPCFSVHIFVHKIICPIVVSYFPVSDLASMHACAVCS